MVKDMTSGNPMRLLISFSIPLLIGNIFQQLYSMVDTIIVGRYISLDALAAVGATGSMSFLVLGFALGLTTGFSVIVSHRFGANDEAGLRRAVAMSVVLSAAMSVVMTVLSLGYSRALLELLDTPPEIIERAAAYVNIIYAGIVTSMFYNLLSAILRALGDSKTPLYVLIAASLLNVVLDFAFIMIFKMDVGGAALATVISQLVSCIVCVVYIYKKFPILRLKKQDFKMDWHLCGTLMKIGLPAALQYSVNAVGGMILQGVVNKLGRNAMAAYVAANRVDQLATQPFVTFGVAMSTYTAQNLGGGKVKRIYDGINKCIIISLISCVLDGVLIFAFGKYITMLFMPKEDLAIAEQVVALSVQYLRTTSLFYTPLGLLFVYRNAIQGLGNGMIPMISGAVELSMRLIVAVAFSASLGFTAICWASPIAWIAAAILLIISFYVCMRGVKKKYSPIVS